MSQKRDDWMLGMLDDLLPSTSQPKQEKVEKPKISSREINPMLKKQPVAVGPAILFGDKGSGWRMMKLKKVFEIAQAEKRSVEQVALERYGSLEDFEMALKERDYLDSKETDEFGRSKPKSHNFKRPGEVQEPLIEKKQRPSIPHATVSKVSQLTGPVLSIDELNKLQSKALKAQLMGAPNAQSLEDSYQREKAKRDAMDATSNMTPMEQLSLLANTQQKDTKDLSIQEMLLEEKSGSKYSYDKGLLKAVGKSKNLDEMDDQAHSALSTKPHKEKLSYPTTASPCPYCFTNDYPSRLSPIAVGTRVCLAFPDYEDFVSGHCLIVPLQHYKTMIECDDDEWDEIRNFMKCILRFYASKNKGVLFIEQAIKFKKSRHAWIECIPVSANLYNDAPAYFKDAILAAEGEWSQHKKLIDTSKGGIRRSMVSNLPYFHVWFDPNRGYGHVIEDEANWSPFFGKEIIGGMMDIEPRKWRKPKRLDETEKEQRLSKFKKSFEPFDWTRMLQ